MSGDNPVIQEAELETLREEAEFESRIKRVEERLQVIQMFLEKKYGRELENLKIHSSNPRSSRPNDC